jgi:hypothetical protein
VYNRGGGVPMDHQLNYSEEWNKENTTGGGLRGATSTSKFGKMLTSEILFKRLSEKEMEREA